MFIPQSMVIISFDQSPDNYSIPLIHANQIRSELSYLGLIPNMRIYSWLMIGQVW